MTRAFEEYLFDVEHAESTEALSTIAKRSFEPFPPSDAFVGGEKIREYYQAHIDQSTHRQEYRTPIQRERDRIVHSAPLRNLAEKFHVLYYRDQRISRNYITHAMRMAQITRAICRGLKLNQDFAETIALASKVGSTPFKHVANDTIALWVESMVQKAAGVERASLPTASGISDYPSWVSDCPSSMQEPLLQAIPVAKMQNAMDRGYSAGKQSYLLLMTNPYVLEDTQGKWQRETAYGIWRHSLGMGKQPERAYRFHYLSKMPKSLHEFSWQNETYEAMVVRLADDITWVIENFQDANYAHLISSHGQQDLLTEVHRVLIDKVDERFLNALARKDPGDLYNYFISDCVENSNNRIAQIEKKHPDWFQQRLALRNGEPEADIVSLSEKGHRALDAMKAYLVEQVFGDPRTANRNQVLATILRFVAGHLFGKLNVAVPPGTQEWIHQRSRRYPGFRAEDVISRSNQDPFFRIQVVVNIMSEMSDTDIFHMVGMGVI